MSPVAVCLSLCLAALIFSAPVKGQSWSEETCQNQYTECLDLADALSPGDCAHANETLVCLDTHLSHCVSGSLHTMLAKQMTINNYYCPSGCSTEPTVQDCINSFQKPAPTTEPSPLPPSSEQICQYTPHLSLPNSIFSPPLSDLGSASLCHPNPKPECTLPSFYRQHCSLFSLTHLRTFGDRNLPIQTALLIGDFYLFRHEFLSISVHGELNTGTVGAYTRITEVNVTLHRHNCFQQTFVYSATKDGLPESVTRPGLHLSVVNGTLATIIAPWINTTIIIHRNQGYLSVTLQVPEPLSWATDVSGLCSDGFDVFLLSDTELELPGYQCLTNRANVSIMCLSLHLSLPPVGTVTYSDLCVYDILSTHNLSLLSLYSALNNDALLLPDVTEIFIDLPTRATSETTPTTSSHPQVVSSVVIMPPSDNALLSQTAPSANPFPSLTLLTLCLSLLLR